MGGHRGFHINSDIWHGGNTAVFTIGHAPYAMKLAFKEMHFRTGGKPPSFGVPATHLLEIPRKSCAQHFLFESTITAKVSGCRR
ncbi:hypothetical protein ACOJVU_11340 [Mycobacterium sp. THU-M104]|uniref:hypothetical protein n=1 Tax=Mycobacterium sp. THU-M104 TaxID=3410515 RepID=UPI003B992A5A